MAEWAERGGGGLGSGSVAPNVLVSKNTITDVLDNTCYISDFSAHTFCPQTTQELPKKHSEGGPPGQLPIAILMHCYKSITDTLDTVKITCANEQ